MDNINYLDYQKEILLKWISNMPKSQTKKIKNILSIDSGNGLLDKNVINYFPNIEKYYLLQSEYDDYKKCINNLFGNFKFKISYNDLFDYELDPYLSYDLVIFFEGITKAEDCSEFINKCIKLMNKTGQIWIFTHIQKGIINHLKEILNIDHISDRLLIKNLDDINCKVFNTHIPTYFEINNFNKKNLSKLLKYELNDDELLKLKTTIKNEYGNSISVPIAVVILSKFRID